MKKIYGFLFLLIHQQIISSDSFIQNTRENIAKHQNNLEVISTKEKVYDHNKDLSTELTILEEEQEHIATHLKKKLDEIQKKNNPNLIIEDFQTKFEIEQVYRNHKTNLFIEISQLKSKLKQNKKKQSNINKKQKKLTFIEKMLDFKQLQILDIEWQQPATKKTKLNNLKHSEPFNEKDGWKKVELSMLLPEVQVKPTLTYVHHPQLTAFLTTVHQKKTIVDKKVPTQKITILQPPNDLQEKNRQTLQSIAHNNHYRFEESTHKNKRDRQIVITARKNVSRQLQENDIEGKAVVKRMKNYDNQYHVFQNPQNGAHYLVAELQDLLANSDCLHGELLQYFYTNALQIHKQLEKQKSSLSTYFESNNDLHNLITSKLTDLKLDSEYESFTTESEFEEKRIQLGKAIEIASRNITIKRQQCRDNLEARTLRRELHGAHEVFSFHHNKLNKFNYQFSIFSLKNSLENIQKIISSESHVDKV